MALSLRSKDGFSPPASLADAVSDYLGRAIAEGRLRPGQRLIETQLCDELGVSRTPMREALRKLAAEGIVDISSRKGARVAELTRSSVTDVFTVRATLEALAAELAATRPDSYRVEELGELNGRMREELRVGNSSSFFG